MEARPQRPPVSVCAARESTDAKKRVTIDAQRAKKLARKQKNSCIVLARRLFRELPNFARACGRVPVGGHPDKRPDSRPE
jgi:hypothetical protein